MTPQEIETLFTRDTGDYVFARWGRPIAPTVFGVEDETLSVVKGAFEAVTTLAGHEMAETDPELGTNCMIFFFREWSELLAVPDLDKMVADLPELVARLAEQGANQYRVFRFEEDGAIQAAFVFLRMDEQMLAQPADSLALSQVVQTVLVWSEGAFRTQSPLAIAGEATILRPEIANVIQAAYDPVLPAVSRDKSHALRLFARVAARA
ncbi:hypothetical protein DS909_02315 [Phaeobacter gallaeciensis]|uniref:Uncharacterized protein n=2 Tax=Roseobacteraceae TaxID=2854170 RepID=A0A366XDX3_9RHOB|nr:hypothetical protein [Phaeobacter gallaeciensis]MBT3142677.1 hypothetical protein [Falsiruegeria litorea]MBT8168201.1 hypothetical protein [Falsiruegeria litorea]RBW61566.1 hypothetical protein DS909_02315 [Phaeobacter gallaeciensis]